MTRFAHLQESQIPTMARIVSDAFNMDEAKCALWIERSKLENWRALAEGEQILGGLLRFDMGQWYGGRPVGLTGLAGVAISTAGRGRRAGQELMRATLQEIRDQGTALSALYGSITPFYRRCGYERAGSRLMAEVSLRELPGRSGPLEVRDLSEGDHAEVEAFYAQHVRQHGALLRCPYLWVRVRGPRGKTAQGYGFYRDGRLEGYTYLVKELGDFKHNTLEATDVVLTTPDAVQTFLGLLAGHRAFFTHASWPSPASSALLLQIPEIWQYGLKLEEHWMLRIVHLERALTERGYAAHLQGELHLQVEDPWFEENSGRWLVKVEGGRATVERGGDGSVGLDIGALAALYTGFMSAESLALAGRLSGASEPLALATAVFGSNGPPDLPDFF